MRNHRNQNRSGSGGGASSYASPRARASILLFFIGLVSILSLFSLDLSSDNTETTERGYSENEIRILQAQLDKLKRDLVQQKTERLKAELVFHRNMHTIEAMIGSHGTLDEVKNMVSNIKADAEIETVEGKEKIDLMELSRREELEERSRRRRPYAHSDSHSERERRMFEIAKKAERSRNDETMFKEKLESPFLNDDKLNNAKTKQYIDSQPPNAKGFPVVLLTYNRPERLNTTLGSLLKVRGIVKEKVLGVQDGTIESVTNVLRYRRVLINKRIETPMDRKRVTLKNGKIDGGAKIAMHYGYSLRKAFETFPDAPAIVVIEDDFLFSPDFMEFFVSVAPTVETDDTLWIASAWNDNGFQENVNVKDHSKILRTDQFPGLGWMLLRSIWTEISQNWPANQWDWYMRNPLTSKWRDCVYPEVPRDFHTGTRGTFMDADTHKKYFDRIRYNTDANFRWSPNVYKEVRVGNYEKSFVETLKSSVHVTEGWQLEVPSDIPLVVWYVQNPHPSQEKSVKPLMERFGIWHQLMRGSRQGVHEFWYRNKKVIFINTYNPPKMSHEKMKKQLWFWGYRKQTKWISYKPKGIPVFKPMDLLYQMKQPLPKDVSLEPNFAGVDVKITAASKDQTGESCSTVCVSKHLSCNAKYLPLINNCDTLKEYFNCKKCTESVGGDQPNFVSEEGDSCLVNSDPSYFSCEGHFYSARRLCPCM
uniref:alpha-1,3-mannosyl-glycoprotein 2-beta-N-acetylglucosaminyltransferase n=1 Tax=Aplanochytrium stocchinoi TaxID=215587 RepID=A0A7S3PPY5_9STRA|mmetsp:Transcript_4180/g.4882  ORF Transcript_4180/g.4882 Transcript_4180/m.4882 type:complete len:706 (-) Transcript_4180:169-2286(-)